MPPHTAAAASSAALPHAATLAADSTAANVSAHAAILVSAGIALLGFAFGLVVLGGTARRSCRTSRRGRGRRSRSARA